VHNSLQPRRHTAAAKRSVDYVTDCAISRVCKICMLIQAVFHYFQQDKRAHRLVTTFAGTVISVRCKLSLAVVYDRRKPRLNKMMMHFNWG
jgi:hypothetical protein